MRSLGIFCCCSLSLTWTHTHIDPLNPVHTQKQTCRHEDLVASTLITDLVTTPWLPGTYAWTSVFQVCYISWWSQSRICSTWELIRRTTGCVLNLGHRLLIGTSQLDWISTTGGLTICTGDNPVFTFSSEESCMNGHVSLSLNLTTWGKASIICKNMMQRTEW